MHDKETFGTGINNCNCANSIFCDPEHGHIITGNLQFIKNNNSELKHKVGPCYREPRLINWGKCQEKIESGLSVCIDQLEKNNSDVDDVVCFNDDRDNNDDHDDENDADDEAGKNDAFQKINN
jgi:hypothetical protein